MKIEKKEVLSRKNLLFILLFVNLLLLIILVFILGGFNLKSEGSDFIDKKFNGIYNERKNFDERFLIDLKNVSYKNKVINLELVAEEKSILFNNKEVMSYTYNGLVPGPIIKAIEGDILNATLINKLSEGTTIHWHGLEVPNNMDGVPYVTQEPVKPNDSFNYKFKLNRSGIYWYHSHVNTSEQIGRGLYGILIVSPKNEPLKFDKEQIIVLDDIRLDSNGNIAPFGSMMDAHMAGRYGNNYFLNGEEKLILGSKKNTILKLDLLNTANARIFDFKIEGHKLLKIGDGIGRMKLPVKLDSIILAPGERAEILVLLNNSMQNEFKLLNLATREPSVIGKLIYEDNFVQRDESKEKYFESLVGEDLAKDLPDWSDKLSLEPDVVFNLFPLMGPTTGFRWTINGNYYPEKPDIQNLTKGRFYKMRYVNKLNIVHPMHLHGQKFIVLSRNGVPQNETMYKDTILVFPNEYVDIGLIAQGEGSWLNHCHILEHADAGMLGILNIK